MVYNDPDYLRIWLDYYGRQVAPRHCYIVDHGSDDGSTQGLDGFNVVRLPRSPQDDQRRATFLSEFCSALLLYYDAVLHVDVDEIVVADPRHHASLADCASASDRPVATAVGLNVLHRFETEPPFDPGRPVLRQRRFVFKSSSMCKPVLIRRPVVWSPGFHSADAPVTFEPLFLFHLRWFDLPTALRRLAKTRVMPWQDTAAGAHQRVSDAAMAQQFGGFASLPPSTADLDLTRPPVSVFAAEVIDSQRGRERDLYRISLDIWPSELWSVPPRFQDAF
jgi:hypothetical protein